MYQNLTLQHSHSRYGAVTTQIRLAIDANGYPINFEITGGEVRDSQVASQLIQLVGEADYSTADKIMIQSIFVKLLDIVR